MRVAVLSNEFFDPEHRVGGFGWAAREAARVLAARGDGVVLLSGELHANERGRRPEIDGFPLVPRYRSPLTHARAVRRARPDVLLAIDFAPNYLPVLRLLPDVPVVVWVRDPRDAGNEQLLTSLRIPGTTAAPQGVAAVDFTGIGELARKRRLPIVFGSPAPALLGTRAANAYRIPDLRLRLLPNPIPPLESPAPESSAPRVVFLARLDPYKRPWVVVEIARRMPEVEFVLLGRAHFSGPGGWQPVDLPPNVQLAGHVDGAEKDRWLSSAWALINTSLHEGLPVSFFESWAAGTPVVSGLDPDGSVSRGGVALGVADGDGLQSVPAFVTALRELFGDTARRQALGAAGRDWVRSTHTPAAFVRAFDELRAEASQWSQPGSNR